jgi:hypothetical protein avisC_05697
MDDMGWESGGFALASGYDAARDEFIGLRVPPHDDAPPITDETVLVAPALARAQRDREEAAAKARAREAVAGTDESSTAAVAKRAGVPVPAPGRCGRTARSAGARVENSRFKGDIELDPGGDIAVQLASLAEEILVHLRDGGADSLEIAVSIEATRYTGFDRATVRTVTENARVLGLKPGRFGD